MFNKIIEKLKTRKLLVVILLLFFVINIFAIFNTFTEKTTSSIWDGVVATSFKSGTGSASDPFVINDGRELAFFFKLINSEDNEDYFNKFYTITNNIDLNGYDFSFAEFNKTFSGNLDGNGYTIFNFKISKYSVDEETDTAHFNLFDGLYSANIKNINFSNITIDVDADEIINERPKEEAKKTTELLKKYNVKFVNDEVEEPKNDENDKTTTEVENKETQEENKEEITNNETTTNEKPVDETPQEKPDDNKEEKTEEKQETETTVEDNTTEKNGA